MGFAGLLWVSGCWLERVTGEEVPLDPRFYAAVEAQQGDPGVGGAASIPFSAHDGPMVTVRGKILSAELGPIELDVRTPDPLAEGGVKGHGKVQVDEVGPFELRVPAGLGPLELQAFQDPDADGPGGNDPFAQIQLVVGETDIEDVEMTLVAGARGSGGGPEHHEAAPGAPGGDPNGGHPHQEMPPGGGESAPPPEGPSGDGPPGAGGPPSPGGMPPFVGMNDDTVTLSGNISWSSDSIDVFVDLDLFQPSESAGGGREMLGKLKVRPGAFSFQAPRNFGPLVLEAFIDLAGDGPGPGDPMGTYSGNPVSVGGRDITGIDIVLLVPEDGRMPGTAPPPPGRAPGL